jgi:hypothetical protein
MVRWLAEQPQYKDDDDPVVMLPAPNGTLVGDRLEHALELIAFDEPCPTVRARLHRAWLLVGYLPARGAYTSGRCLDGVPPSFRGPDFRVYRPGPSGAGGSAAR